MRSLQILQDRLGEKLEEVQVLVHYFGGLINGLISYKLIFESKNLIVVSLGPEGDSLKIRTGDLKENDLEEYGSTKLLSVSEYDPAMIKRGLGNRLDRCRAATDSYKVYGIELYFESVTISFSNVDDEMVFGKSLDNLDVGSSVKLMEFPLKNS
jgi:hypothetical protein